MQNIDCWESNFQPCEYSDKLLNLIVELNKKARVPVNLLEIKKACYVAREYHGSQLRKSGDPYYSHPLIVAYLFAEYVARNTPKYYTTELIIIAILHDTIEDTMLTYEMIVGIFAKIIAEGVQDLTRIKDNMKHEAWETLDSLHSQGKIGVLYIKLFDRFHNAITLNFMSSTKQIRIASETYDHFTIYAEYLGLYELNNKLIDICSLYLDDIKQCFLRLESINPSYSQDNCQIFSPTFQNEITQMYNL